MIISLIAAHDPNLVIGNNGSLPWNIPEDMAHFKHRTTGHVVIMGRGVFEELGKKPLPGRRNIVVTRTRNYQNVGVCRNIEQVFEMVRKEQKIYIIGGAQLYRLFYPVCNRLEITEIHEPYEGDTFFPEYRHQIGIIWKEIARIDKDKLSFIDYERMQA